MLITEVWGAPLNLAPKGSTLLVSPSPGLVWSHSFELGCLVEIPALPLLAT